MRLADATGVSRPTVHSFVKRHGVDAVLTQLCNLHNFKLKKTVKNPGGWLRSALENNYFDTAAHEKQQTLEKKALRAQREKEAQEKAALTRQDAQAAFEESQKSATPATFNLDRDGMVYHFSLRRMKRFYPGMWDAWPQDFHAMMDCVLDPQKRIPLFEHIDANYRDLAIERTIAAIEQYKANFAGQAG